MAAKGTITKPSILKVTENKYNALISDAVFVARNTNSPEAKDEVRFLFQNSLPTIDLLKKKNIGPFPECTLDEETLFYLIYYSEKYCVDEENDVYEYIFVPDPDDFDEDEIADFEETRSYMRKTILKRTEMVF